MNVATIDRLAALHAKRNALKFSAAKAIRETLDATRQQWGSEEDFDDNAIQDEILELVIAESES